MDPSSHRLFAARFGGPPVRSGSVAADGSQRRMARLHAADGRTAVAVEGPDSDENRAFLSFSRTFRDLGLPVPEVYGGDEGAGVYLVEDLGDVTLFRALSEARGARGEGFPPELLPIYRRVLEFLPRFQVEGGRAVDFSVAYPREAFDRQSMQWDLDYFKYHFLKLAHVRFHEERLHRDFGRLIDFLLAADPSHFLYRDFQSRNVMLRGGEPWFIDYQGGRRGALAYDVASLLYDAKAAIPDEVREDLFEHYLASASRLAPIDADDVRRRAPGFVLIRILQAMGAYGYRGFYEGKTHFLQSVPLAVRNLEGLLGAGFLPIDVPELHAVVERVCSAESLRGAGPFRPTSLTLTVGSFSYARGFPEDRSGHGGGYVFDCRAIENPGKRSAFAGLSGLDSPVASFLDARPDFREFLAHSIALVDAQVRAYRARGFTSLDVRFGCTGGRHRSVHAAERLARAIEERHPGVRVVVEHRERALWNAAAPAGVPSPLAAAR